MRRKRNKQVKPKWSSYLNMILLQLVLFILCPVVSLEAEEIVTIKRINPQPASVISDLSWEGDAFPVQTNPLGEDNFQIAVILKGAYRRPEWTLVRNSKVIQLDKDQRFSIDVIINNTAETFDLYAIGPNGDYEREKVVLDAYNIEELRTKLTRKQLKSSHFSLGLAGTMINYQQTRQADISELATTVKASYLNQVFPPSWDFGIATYITAFPVSTSGTKTPLRFFGFNIRAGYVVPYITSPWRLSILAGYYYATVFSAPGFRNLAGPQIFPALNRSLPHDRSVSLYAKYSPVSSGFNLLSLTNREFAAGGGYSFPLRNGHPLFITFDFANLNLRTKKYLNSPVINISSTTYSLGCAYGF